MKTITVKQIQKPLEKQLKFERKGDARMDVKIKFDGEKLTISGTMFEWSDNIRAWHAVGWGQTLDDLIQYFVDMPNAKRLYEIWERWHLNDLNAGDEVQETHLRLAKEGGWKYDYDEARDKLHNAGLLVHNGYEYGTGWKFEQVPAKVIDELRNM